MYITTTTILIVLLLLLFLLLTTGKMFCNVNNFMSTHYGTVKRVTSQRHCAEDLSHMTTLKWMDEWEIIVQNSPLGLNP